LFPFAANPTSLTNCASLLRGAETTAPDHLDSEFHDHLWTLYKNGAIKPVRLNMPMSIRNRSAGQVW
jgi:hypothetical protein